MLRWLIMTFVIVGIAMTATTQVNAQESKGFTQTVIDWVMQLFSSEEITLSTNAEAPILYYYVGQLSWVYDNWTNTSSWQVPITNVSYKVYDFRPKAGRTARGGTANGYAIFQYDAQVDHPNLTYLGTVDEVLRNNVINSLKTDLGVSGFSGNTVKDVIVDMYTTHSDPTGVSAVPTLMPGNDGKIVFADLNISIKVNLSEVDSFNTKVLARVWQDYRDRRNRSIILPENHTNYNQHLRYLDWLTKKYGVDNYTIFIPPDLEDEGILKHRTTVVDNFTYSDGDLNTVSSGAWVYGDNSFSISSNVAVPDAFANNWATFQTELDGDDHYARIEIGNQQFNNNMGPIVRVVDQTDNSMDAYVLDARSDSGADSLRIAIIENGVKTVLQDTDCTCTDLATGDEAYLQIDGTNLTVKIDGTVENSVLNSVHSGSGFTGISGGRNTQTFDNFGAGDLAAGDLPAGNLDVYLNGSQFLSTTQNLTVNLSANVTCEGTGGCGSVNVTAYRSVVGGGGQTNIPFNTTVLGLPAYNETGLINQSAGTLADAGVYQYLFIANLTGSPGVYNYTINFTNGTNVNGTWGQFNITLPEPAPEVTTCDCPSPAGNWTISDGSICTLTSSCDITGYNFSLQSGGLYIQVGVTLTANQCRGTLGNIVNGTLPTAKMICGAK